MKPKSPDEYLSETEHAVRHFYAGLASCWSYYQQALQYWDISKVGQPLTDELRADLNRHLELAGKYFDLKFSEAVFAGAILQVAAVGIRYFSRNELIPSSCVAIVPAKAKGAIPFCIGREMHGLPLGLIIYAARNQYNHWEVDPHPVTHNVFAALSKAFRHNMMYDLAFDISNPTITVYANEVLLGALRWQTYDQYQGEMRQFLQQTMDA